MSRIGIVTISDTRTAANDESGPAAQLALTELGFFSFETRLVRDVILEIQAAVLDLCKSCDIVFTTGGTGFTPRDVTPEATIPLIERRADNLSQLMRLRGLEHTPLSHLSRGVAGIRGKTLIVNLPGSPRGARQGVEAIGALLPAILGALSGDSGPVT